VCEWAAQRRIDKSLGSIADVIVVFSVGAVLFNQLSDAGPYSYTLLSRKERIRFPS